MIAVTGALAALLTNDVALFLVIPFTMLFRARPDLDLAPVVVLEVAASNVLGCVSPIGNPQNLFLYTRGGFSPATFFAAQVPWCRRGRGRCSPRPCRCSCRAGRLAAPPVGRLRRRSASGRRVPRSCSSGRPRRSSARSTTALPLLLGSAARSCSAGTSARPTSRSSLVFAFLFVGVAGLERGRLYEALDPVRDLRPRRPRAGALGRAAFAARLERAGGDAARAGRRRAAGLPRAALRRQCRRVRDADRLARQPDRRPALRARGRQRPQSFWARFFPSRRRSSSCSRRRRWRSSSSVPGASPS